MSANLKYRRVLLKVSGEALMGERDYGLDPAMIARIAEEIQTVHGLGVELCLVIGSSLVVYPAAAVPRYALEAGAKLAIVNATETYLDDAASVLAYRLSGG